MSSETTRRVVMGGLGGLLSISALAKPESTQGKKEQSAPKLEDGLLSSRSKPLSLRLDFADGKTLSLDSAKAAYVGDYIGRFVQQKCFRLRASGNGDYRDGFTVFFRPDSDGNRNEVVIEYGGEVDFRVKPPQPAGGIAVSHTPGYTATISRG